MRLTFVLLAVLAVAVGADAQGTIKGCVTDATGGKLPGPELVAVGVGTRERTVTNASGCYEINGLREGTYAVTATLSGFKPVTRDAVSVVADKIGEPVDFVMCIGGSETSFIDWFLPSDGLDGMWEKASVVAHVRIKSTAPRSFACPSVFPGIYFEHSAAVIEVLKPKQQSPPISTIAFLQEIWHEEKIATYREGDELLVYLTASPVGLLREAGPFGVFLFRGNQLSSWAWQAETAGVTPAEFLATLRAKQRTSAKWTEVDRTRQ